jgi:hypothetical protein
MQKAEIDVLYAYIDCKHKTNQLCVYVTVAIWDDFSQRPERMFEAMILGMVRSYEHTNVTYQSTECEGVQNQGSAGTYHIQYKSPVDQSM